VADKLKIEKGIPIPKVGSGRKEISLIYGMEIGDCILVPDKKSSQISSFTRHAEKTRGFRFTRRTVEGGVRIWMIK
jgi:hypothetical protein